jgi:ABC-2 type transport system permease protein
VTPLVRSELLKVRTTRGWWAYLIAIVLLVGIATAGDTGSNPALRDQLRFQLNLLETAGFFASVLGLILGITAITTEFRHGTITPTLLGTPSRERVLGAKAVAATLVGLLFGVLALVVTAAIALPWLSIVGDESHLADPEIAKRAGQLLGGVVLWTLMGLAIGSVVHSQVAALVGTLVWIFVGEGLLWGLFALLDLDGAVGYLPFRALQGTDGTGDEEMLGYGTAIAVSLAWIAAIGAAGTVRTRRRDIT